MNYFSLPLLNPFKFVPSTQNPGIHFDDDWACMQIKSFERRVFYRQKWVRANTTKLQCESTLPPQPLSIRRAEDGVQVKTIPWTVVFTGVSYKVYELLFSIADLPQGVYVLYAEASFMALRFAYISEAIDSRDKWPNTLLFNYKNSFNDFDVAFSTGIDFNFRCEAGIMDFDPKRSRVAYVNQVASVETLSGVAWRAFKLYIGEAPGVAPWVVDLLNRIFLCDYINIENKLYQSEEGSKWEVTRVKGYPLIGAAIDIVEQYNLNSIQLGNTAPIANGIVIAYNIETTFFGPGNVVPVEDVEKQY